MKPLKFSPELISEILSGKKTSTWRLFDDKNLTAGDGLDLINKETGKSFAHAEIVDVSETTLSKLYNSNFEGHEKYTSPEEMYRIFQSYYHQPLCSDTSVKIVHFKII